MKEVILETKLVGLWDWQSLNYSLWFNDGNHFKEYKERLRQFGWSSIKNTKNIPMIPIFQLPKELQNTHKFVVIDGNRRLFHSLDVLQFAPFYLFDKDEAVDFNKFNIRLFETPQDKVYERTIEKYQYTKTHLIFRTYKFRKFTKTI